jgi:hypothetical protein
MAGAGRPFLRSIADQPFIAGCICATKPGFGNSLITGKIEGISHSLSSDLPLIRLIGPPIQILAAKFPTPPNREFFEREQRNEMME